MLAVHRCLIVAAAFAATAFLPDSATARSAPGPRQRHARLSTPAEIGASGRIDSTFWPGTRARRSRSRLVLTMKRLPARKPFSLSVTYRPRVFDPTESWSLPNQVVTSRTGQAKVVWDTRRGGTLPLGGSLKDLVGRVLRVEDAQGQVVLYGPFPKAP